jgi:hypothetical protein
MLLLPALRVCAQQEIFRPDHDDVPYYFGASFSYVSSSFHTTKNLAFLQGDSILSAEPGSGGGIALGFLFTGRISRRFEARFNPQLIMGSARKITYQLKNPGPFEEPVVTQNLPSTIITFPLHLKFNSDRIQNFRVYTFGGMKFDIDLASNSGTRNAENMVKLKKYDYGAEIGIGFNFFTPFVTVSPEIKFSTGLGNIHARDASLKYSNIFDKIQNRMIFLTLNLED